MVKIRISITICLLSCSLFSKSNKEILIQSVSLIGNRNVTKNEALLLVRQKSPNLFFKNKFDGRLVRLDALTLKNYYFSKGFLDAAVVDSVSHNIIDERKYANIFYIINEGRQYFVSDINISGNNLINDEKICSILGLKLNRPYDPVGLNDRMYLLENEYQEIGKLFFTISLDDVIDDSVKINIEIDEGEFVYINKTNIKKSDKIDNSIVIRELDYSSGDRYSKSAIDKTTKRLKEIGVFSTASLKPIKTTESDTLVNINIDLIKYKQREWNSSGGLNPISFAEGTPPLPALSAIIEWRNRSFFNSPKQFSTKILMGIPAERVEFVAPRLRFDMSIATNWILDIRFPTKVIGYYEKFIIYDNQQYQGSINRFGANLAQRVNFFGRSYFESRSRWENFGDASEDNIVERSISFKINIDKKDDPLFTRKGYLIGSTFKATGFGGTRNYNKADFLINLYYPLARKTIYAMRIQIGKLWKWDETYVDRLYEKFYLGGSTSMRAWDVLRFNKSESNEPEGGTFRFMTNIEFRQKLYRNFGMTIFSDGGLLSNNIPNTFFNKLDWGIGLGLTLDTPLGPLRLDYAVQVENINAWQIQLGVQNLF